MDGTIPRRQLPQVLHAHARSCRSSYGLRVANVFHAGDGNLHPLILYDANKPGELERAEAFGADILRLCVEVGGVLTGEHGVGVEKRDLMPAMFTEVDLDQQQRSSAPSIRKACSIPARCFRSCTAAPSSAACTCHGGKLPLPRPAAVLMNARADSARERRPSVGRAALSAIADDNALEFAGRGTKRRSAAPRDDASCSTFAASSGVIALRARRSWC